jgi:hypothetical protein
MPIVTPGWRGVDDNASDSDQGETNPVQRRDGAGDTGWAEIPDAAGGEAAAVIPFGVKQIVLVDDPWHNDAFVGTPAEGMMGDGPREKQFHCEDYAGNLVARFDATCPYGQPGDRLWVKETWQHLHNDGSPLERLHDWKKPRSTVSIAPTKATRPPCPYRASGVPPSTCPLGQPHYARNHRGSG